MRKVPTLADEQRSKTRNRLFRYDGRIVVNEARAALYTWQDRIIAAAGLLICLAGVRSLVVDLPWRTAAATALVAGVVLGLIAGRLIATRLAFHGFDGPLAGDALCAPIRRLYTLGWHATALGLLAAVTLIARPALLMDSLPGYAIGALLGQATANPAATQFASGWQNLGRTARSWAQTPRAGLVAAAALLVSTALVAGSLQVRAVTVLVAVEAILLALALTQVDDAIVRFRTIAGHGVSRIVGDRARGAIVFVAVAGPGAALAFGPVFGGVVAIATTAALLLMTLRILAYRLHARCFADMIVTLLVAFPAVIAVWMPILAPPVASILLWRLWRRAAAKTWLLA